MSQPAHPDRQKRCSRCGETKPLDDFYRSRRDGWRSQCKKCSNASARAWAKANNKAHLERKAKYRAENRERRSYTDREWRRKNPEKVAAQNDRQRKRHPERAGARSALQAAVYRGRVVKPDSCEQCEAAVDAVDLHAHHADYSKPLEVEWLCRGCHAGRHRAPDRQALRDLPKGES